MALHPVSRFILWSEKVRLEERVMDLLSDETKRIWFYPSAAYSSDDGLFLGGKFQFNNMWYERKNLAATADLYTNLDHKFSLSYSRSTTISSQIFYKLRTSYGHNSNTKFYGFGIDSGIEDKSIYSDTKANATVKLGWRFPRLPFLSMATTVGPHYSRTGPGNPANDNLSIHEQFDPDTLDGYDEENIWLRYGLEVSYDSSLPTGNPVRGGKLSLGVDRYEDFWGGHSYLHLESHATRFVALGSHRRILAFSGRFISVENWGGEVPFQRLSSLGESSPLRGFNNGRFRDRRLLVGNVEYRFMVWQAVRAEPLYGMGIIFFDFGRTFGDFEELTDFVIKTSVGTGLLIASTKSFFLRAQVGYVSLSYVGHLNQVA